MISFATGLAFGLGTLLGAIVIGFIANKQPQWFAKVVSAADAVDTKVNQTISKKS